MLCGSSSKTGVLLHTGAIGDCLLTLPLAAFIKEAYGLSRLEFIGPQEYIEFYPARTCIDAVISSEAIDLFRLFEDSRSFESSDHDRLLKTFARYEQVVSFLGHDHPAFERNLLFTVHSTHSADVTLIPAKPPTESTTHVSNFYLDVFRREQLLENDVEPDFTTVCPLAGDDTAGRDLLEQAGIDPDQTIVLIQPGSGSLQKCWHWENFIQTANELKANGLRPVFLLGPAEQQRFSDKVKQAIGLFDNLENLSLTQVVQVLTQAAMVLANDSGIAHLAAGMGKRTLVLFGPTNPAQFAPRGEKVVIERIREEDFHCPVPTVQAEIAQKLLAMR